MAKTSLVSQQRTFRVRLAIPHEPKCRDCCIRAAPATPALGHTESAGGHDVVCGDYWRSGRLTVAGQAFEPAYACPAQPQAGGLVQNARPPASRFQLGHSFDRIQAIGKTDPTPKLLCYVVTVVCSRRILVRPPRKHGRSRQTPCRPRVNHRPRRSRSSRGIPAEQRRMSCTCTPNR